MRVLMHIARHLTFVVFVAIAVSLAVFLGRTPTAIGPVVPRSIITSAPPEEPVRIVAVGDVMLGRFVEALSETNGIDYPFRFIRDELKGDIVIGNLEGAIVTDHVPSPINSFTLSFKPAIAALLRAVGFTHLTLGNNHTADLGATGLRETREYLLRAGLVPVGDPLSLSGASSATTTIRGVPLAFFSMNETYHRHTAEQAADAVRALRAREPKAFLIAAIHWGDEYAPMANAEQRALAAAVIGAGADLVIGHHPHVVQDVEMVEGNPASGGARPVFYSLGNFIFDQYFMKETQQELLLRIAIEEKNVRYELVPLQSVRSQPAPMEGDAKKAFLEALAGRSDVALGAKIRAGMILLDK